jgi:hypothetical protein
VEVHSCNPNPQKAKAENFKYSMGYTVETPSQKKKKKGSKKLLHYID